jgi:Peptidase family M41
VGGIRKIEATAHHEAGHAVVAWSLGIPLRHATIIPDEDSIGHVLFHKLPKWCEENSRSYSPDRARIFMEKRIQINLAGQIAEKVFRGRRPNRYSHRSDDDHSVDIAIRFAGTGEIATAWLHWLFLNTRARVELNWKQIQAVASELVKHRRLSNTEVIAAIDASFGLTPFRPSTLAAAG